VASIDAPTSVHHHGTGHARRGDVGSTLERLYAAGHGAWWGLWELWQLLAIAAGAVALLRGVGRHTLRPFAWGVLGAVAGGLLVGNISLLARLVARGRSGPVEIEIAGTGALLGMAAAYAWASRRRGITAARALDDLSLAIGPMWALSRVGCFFAGCDFGAPFRGAWAMRYPPGTAAFGHQALHGLIAADARVTVPVHPSQVYDALAAVLVTIVLRLPRRAYDEDGARFVRMAALFAVARLLTDFLRGDLVRGVVGLTESQWIAAAMLGALLLVRKAPAPITRP
jgi:prolipoprotein diacylglyceryltransferase